MQASIEQHSHWKIVATAAKAFGARIAAANVDPEVILELDIKQDIIYDLGRIDARAR